jgi:predicted component of type VI protein secretion system
LVQEVVRLTVEWSNGGNYTAMQAAHILRLTPTRVRQLLQSGELEGERDEAGHWLIPARAVHERLERLRRESFLEAVGYDLSSVREGSLQELVEVLSSQVEMLRAELDEAHAANRENRRIIAGLVERIPAIEAPAEPRGSSETASEGAEPRSATGAPEEARERPFTSERQAKPSDGSEGPERRGFWSRLFGGGG